MGPLKNWPERFVKSSITTAMHCSILLKFGMGCMVHCGPVIKAENDCRGGRPQVAVHN